MTSKEKTCPPTGITIITIVEDLNDVPRDLVELFSVSCLYMYMKHGFGYFRHCGSIVAWTVSRGRCGYCARVSTSSVFELGKGSRSKTTAQTLHDLRKWSVLLLLHCPLIIQPNEPISVL